ncbi:MAG: hypothetical protein JNN18_15255 [Rubrivivax sp.]|jgi:hypothetical protein|nr:hypothetical protein [Rubrivivax sp.]
MSYVVHLWEQPVAWGHPPTVDAVQAMLDVLRRRRPGPNPRFIDCARLLTARHPCITSPESDGLDESELAWSDGPLDGRTESSVWAIGLNRDRLDEVLPFVRSVARSIGLSVWDEQAGCAWLANGWQRVAGRQPWERFPPACIETGRALPGKDELLDRVLAGAGAALQAIGCTEQRRDPRDDAARSYTSVVLRRDSPVGWQELELRAIDTRPDSVKLSMRVEAWVPAISDWRLRVLHGGAVPAGARPLNNLGLSSHAWMNDTAGVWQTADAGSIVLRSEDDLERTVNMFDTQWRTRLGPLLSGADSMPGLAEALAPGGRLAWSPWFTNPVYAADALVAAHLAGSPRLPALVAELQNTAVRPSPSALGRALFGARDEAMLTHLQACVAQVLRESPAAG